MNNVAAPSVSVCIPVYNCEKYIGQAIESVLTQTYRDLELLILDNASTDGTRDVIRRYTDPRIRIIENPVNIGLEGNWNKALAEARGTFIKLLPADDFLHPDCLEKQVQVFSKPGNEQIVLASCGRDIVGPNSQKLMTRHFPGPARLISGSSAIQIVIRSGTNPLGEPGALCFRRETLLQAGRFDDSLLYVIDIDLWLKVLLMGDLYITPEPLCAFRLSPGSHSIELAQLQSEHFSTFARKLAADPRYKIGWLDMSIGIWMSRLLAIGRRLFYLFTVKK